jgi:hypothetical protein
MIEGEIGLLSSKTLGSLIPAAFDLSRWGQVGRMSHFTQGSNRIFLTLRHHRWLLFGVLSIVASFVTFGLLNSLIDNLDGFIGRHQQCSWIPTRGTITDSELRNHVRPNGEDDWQFTVKFLYDVGGSRHNAQQRLRDFLVVPSDGTKFAEVPYLFTACPDLANLEEAVALFRAAHDTSQFLTGRSVIVYYSPTNIAEAVLVPGLIIGTPLTYGESISLYAFLILFFGGIIMLIKGILNLLDTSDS